jgi:peptide/nickel transport system substrate-binding protein
MMKKIFRFISVILVIILILINLVGCGSENGQQSNSNGEDKNEVIKDSLVISIDWPTFIDPAVGSKGSDSIALLNMYDTLIFPNSDGTISPHLSILWETSEDNMKYIFHLRDDVFFHSGNKFTASDVKFSADRLMTIGEGFAYMFADIIKEVNVIDDNAVEFILNKPSGNFTSILTRLYILDEDTVKQNIDENGTYGDNGDYGKKWLLTNDAGSGPYKVKEMKTEEYLIMEQNENYWTEWGENPPKTVKLIGGLEPTAIQTMISRGELDITNDTQTPEAYNTMENMDGVDIASFLNGINVNLMLNTKKAPTDDIHVRRAIAYSVDYSSIINDIYEDSERATGPVVAGMTAASLDESDMPYSKNKEMALEELTKSKYYKNLIEGDMDISFTWCSEGGLQQEKLALLIQANLAEIGVKLNVTGKPFATMMSDAQTVESTPNASVVAFAPAYLDAGSVLKTRYHSSSCGSWEQMEWLQDDNIDSMIEDAISTVDQDLRNSKYKEIGKELVELCPTVWLSDVAVRNAYRSDNIKSWPVVDKSKNGETFLYAMGYQYYFKDS